MKALSYDLDLHILSLVYAFMQMFHSKWGSSEGYFIDKPSLNFANFVNSH
jgi:hypothetical protein